jgi:hypothetical protein
VDAVCKLPSGDVILGGSFGIAGSVAARNIVRYSPSTGVWSPLGAGVTGQVLTLSLLPGGDVFVGGSFASAGGADAYNAARLNPATGVWSPLSTAGSGVSGTVRASTVVTTANGTVVVLGGDFTSGTSFGSPSSMLRVAAWNPSTGTITALSTGMSAPVHALAVMPHFSGGPGSDLYIGGEFSTATGGPHNYLARLDLTSQAVDSIPAIAGPVYALRPTPSNDIYIGGAFVFAGVPGLGIPNSNNIVRYTPGPGIPSFSRLGTGTSSGGSVRTIEISSDGDVIAGGYFGVGGNLQYWPRIARYRPSTGDWWPFAYGGVEVNSINSAAVRVVATIGADDYLVGGFFDTVTDSVFDSRVCIGVSRVRPQIDGWTALAPGFDGPVRAAAQLTDGSLIAGGEFRHAGTVEARGVVRCQNAAGSVWTPLIGADGQPIRGTPLSVVALTAGNALLLGDAFVTYSNNYGAAARYSASTGTVSATATFTDGEIGTGALLPSGQVLLGGAFTEMAQAPAYNVGRYVGNALYPLASGVGCNSYVVAAAALPGGGDAVIGGYFTTANGLSAGRIARYFGASEALGRFDDGAGLNGPVRSLLVMPNGDVVAGGEFTLAGGTVAVANIARYSAGLHSWTSMGPGPAPGVNGPVYALALLPGGDVAVAGAFGLVGGSGGIAAKNIARWSPASNGWSRIGTGQGPNGPVYALRTLAGGDLLVGGDFTVVDDQVSAYLARRPFRTADVGSQGGVHAPDGLLNNNDFVAYIDLFFSGDPGADLGSQGGVPGSDGHFDNNDFVVFIDLFFGGCV